jgi:hypothetical protein
MPSAVSTLQTAVKKYLNCNDSTARNRKSDMKKVERDNENSENSSNHGIRQFPTVDNILD